MFIIKLVILIFVFNTLLSSDVIEIDDNISFNNVLIKSYILEDKEKSFSKDEVLFGKDLNFIKNGKSVLSYGYNPNSNIWVKFVLKNNSKTPISRILEYDNSLTTDIVLYSPDDNYKGELEGFFNINENRKTINPIFDINLKPNESKTYYLKASSRITTLILKLNLWKGELFIEKESQHKLYLGLFFGAMFILLVYNFFIFFFTKDISYLYYVLYIFGLSFHHYIYVGLCNIYFEQYYLIKVIEYSPLIIFFPILALGLFTKSFLKVNQYKIWNICLNILLVMVTIFAVVITFVDEIKYLRNSFSLFLLLYLLLLTIYAAFKKNRQAYFILAGWSIIFIATLLMVLSSGGIFNIYEYISYPIEIAFILEAIIFSIALADKINTLQSHKEELQNEIIIQHETENKRLEEKVEIKTKDLQVTINEKNLLLRELNHRVKNNMQMIISLLRLQSTDNISVKDVDNILLTIQNRINAMSQLHELLYKQNNVGNIDTYEYFYVLSNELSYSYDEDENIEIKLDINANINIEDSLYCGLILNELLTNSFKYAFPDNIGVININLNKINNEYELIISDNGIGYVEHKNSESLGTILINSLVIDQLSGNIESLTNNGVFTRIRWGGNE